VPNVFTADDRVADENETLRPEPGVNALQLGPRGLLAAGNTRVDSITVDETDFDDAGRRTCRRLQRFGHLFPFLNLGPETRSPQGRRTPNRYGADVGYAFGSFDEMGDGTFRKVRQELDVKAFGANVVVIQPGVSSRPHYHAEQDELYFVHSGRARFDVPGESRELGPGGMAHVESTTPRRVTSIGDEELVMLVVGAKDGYVGRDGHPADPDQFSPA